MEWSEAMFLSVLVVSIASVIHSVVDWLKELQ